MTRLALLVPPASAAFAALSVAPLLAAMLPVMAQANTPGTSTRSA